MQWKLYRKQIKDTIMAYNVIMQKVKALGFCCQFGYSLAAQSLTTLEVSRELGVHLRTARTWKAKVRDGKITCRCGTNCVKVKVQATPPAKP